MKSAMVEGIDRRKQYLGQGSDRNDLIGVNIILKAYCFFK
jgi:hypothetical protein